MLRKVVFLIVFVTSSRAVIIEPISKLISEPKQSSNWEEIKVYHPPSSQAFGHRFEHYAYPKYDFEYAVSDKKTGDHKRHRESRDGDRVEGEYSLIEPNGSLRKVQYHADDYNGFNAVVSNTVNKHGDHAYSTSGHARHFYPFGNGIKINHYFPMKYYHPKNDEAIEKDKPVEEEMTSKKMVEAVPSDDSVMMVTPVETTEQPASVSVDVPKIKVEVPVKVIPGVVSMIMNHHETINSDPKTVSAEKPSEEVSTADKDNQQTDKEDSSSDSAVASSYYHTRFYYVGF